LITLNAKHQMTNFSNDFSRALLVAACLACAALAPAGAAGGSGGGGSGGGGTSSATDTEMPGEILLKLRTGDALPALLSKYPLTLVSRFGARPIYRVKVVGAVRVKDLLASLALEPEVMIAEANPTHRSPEARKNIAWTIGNQQAYAAQWAPQALRLAQAHMLSTGSGVRVAVLDTGVDLQHPALAGRLLPGFDFVDFDNDPSEVGTFVNPSYGHGTHVAGLVALVAPGARIMPLRVLDADGAGNAWVLAEALLYAVNPDGNPSTDDGAHVINLSLGSLARTRLFGTIAQILVCEPSVPGDPVADLSDSGYADDLARCSSGRGAVVVAAAGNDASSGVKQYPAAEGAYGLLAVAASSATARIASFSNSGNWIDIAAPGEAITSALPGGLYGTWSGTSMAAPLAAGTAALLRSRDVQMVPTDVVRRIKRASAMLCGTALRQVDAVAALTDKTPQDIACR
jgi:subtilisin family serine protease